ncbi:MAG: hypothetical protein L3K18_07080 [Thermoplasmata archaeon]|nr:hypothetical protein [Thermoplasmata archaeon]
MSIGAGGFTMQSVPSQQNRARSSCGPGMNYTTSAPPGEQPSYGSGQLPLGVGAALVLIGVGFAIGAWFAVPDRHPPEGAGHCPRSFSRPE